MSLSSATVERSSYDSWAAGRLQTRHAPGATAPSPPMFQPGQTRGSVGLEATWSPKPLTASLFLLSLRSGLTRNDVVQAATQDGRVVFTFPPLPRPSSPNTEVARSLPSRRPRSSAAPAWFSVPHRFGARSLVRTLLYDDNPSCSSSRPVSTVLPPARHGLR